MSNSLLQSILPFQSLTCVALIVTKEFSSVRLLDVDGGGMEADRAVGEKKKKKGLSCVVDVCDLDNNNCNFFPYVLIHWLTDITDTPLSRLSDNWCTST